MASAHFRRTILIDRRSSVKMKLTIRGESAIIAAMDPFKIGDRIIYPNQGLAVIEGIQQEHLYGEDFRFYRVRILSNKTLVLVPSGNTEEMGIRKLMSEDAVEEIFRYLKKHQVDVSGDWKGRYKEHINLMRSGTIFDMACVLKSLYYLSLTKTLSFREKKMLEKVKELLIAEISEVSDLTLQEIEQRIAHTLTLCFKSLKQNVEI
jgi:CarD family transcriptional regulator, regulator of rRNA transcription